MRTPAYSRALAATALAYAVLHHLGVVLLVAGLPAAVVLVVELAHGTT